MFSSFLAPSHHLMMLVKRQIVSLYSQRQLNSLSKQDFLRIKELCEDSISVLGKVDPGYPIWKAETLKESMGAQVRWLVLKRVRSPCSIFIIFHSGIFTQEYSTCLFLRRLGCITTWTVFRALSSCCVDVCSSRERQNHKAGYLFVTMRMLPYGHPSVDIRRPATWHPHEPEGRKQRGDECGL